MIVVPSFSFTFAVLLYVFEEGVMKVVLPVLADVRADDRRAVVQPDLCSALVCLPVPLNVVPLPCNSNPRTPSCDYLHPQDIRCFEGLRVLEDGTDIGFALRLAVLDLPVLIASPSSRRKSHK